jgi:tetratricopeptide (TPR) repeat protein
LAFIVALLTGIPYAVDLPTTAFLLLVGYASLSLLWATQPILAMKEIVRLWAVFWFFLVARQIDPSFLLLALFLPAPAVAIYGLIQQWWRRDPIDPRFNQSLRKRTRFLSFFGNSNYSAAYLAPQVFVGGYLTFNCSDWFIIPTAVVMLGVLFSQCRAAITAAVAGCITLFPEIIPIVIIAAALAIMYRPGCLESITQRFLMVRVCFELWKHKPLFGWGPRSFRTMHWKALGSLNQKGKEIEYDIAIGRRSHNDYAETFVEYGLIGAAIASVFIGSLVYQAIGNPFILAGLVAILVNAIFFYPLRDTGLSLPFLSLAGAIPYVEGRSFILEPGSFSAIGILVVAWLIYLYSLKPFLANYHYTRARTKKALDYDPYHNAYLYRMAVEYMQGQDDIAAMACIEKALHYPDGEAQEWFLLSTYGKVALLNGAYRLAKRAFKSALRLNPNYRDAIEGLRQANNILWWIENRGGK